MRSQRLVGVQVSPGRRLYRTRESTLWYAAGAAVALITAVIVVPEIALGHPPGTKEWIPALFIFLGVLAGYGTLLVRAYLAAVIADSEMIIVRNVTRTHRIRWEDVASIRTTPHALHQTIVQIELRNGETLETYGLRSLASPLGNDDGAVSDAVDDLRAYLPRGSSTRV